MKSLGQRAYEAYCHRASTQDATTLPSWNNLKEIEQVRWQFVGDQIRIAFANAIAHGEAL